MIIVVEISEECVTGKRYLNMEELKLEHKEEAADAMGRSERSFQLGRQNTEILDLIEVPYAILPKRISYR